MSWLQGGSFLELSFIMNEPTKAEKIVSKLENCDIRIEVHIPQEYLQQY